MTPKLCEPVIGLDVSKLSTGVVIVDAAALPELDPKDFHRAVLHAVPWTMRAKATEQEYLLTSADRMFTLLRTPPKFVAFEQFAFGAQSLRNEVAMVTGVLRYTTLANLCQYVCVSPMTVKKFAIPGVKQTERTKEQMLKAVYKNFGFDVSTHDIADAFVVAILAALTYNAVVKHQIQPDLNAAQLECIEAVKKVYPK